MESAQEAMMKMIARGVEVTGMESQQMPRRSNILSVHRTPSVRDY
jgi:hypothetical protein